MQSQQYLTFSLAGEEYAVAVLDVREILEHAPLTRVPGTPTFVRGVLNLRGSVVPVLDLATKFGLGERPITRRTCIVIVQLSSDRDAPTLGVLADSVSQVVELRPDQIEPAPSFGTGARVEHLTGLARLDGKFALVLDVSRVLSAPEARAVLSPAAAPAPEPQ